MNGLTDEVFDYIVIGAGTAGCVIASRLAENDSLSILLVEAGDSDLFGITDVPASLLHTITNPNYDWCFLSEPDQTRNASYEMWSRGKLLGGSSAINGMVFVRGAASDFDNWAALGIPGWDWGNVLPYFKKLETVLFSDSDASDLRGKSGPVYISKVSWRHPHSKAFMDSCVRNGIPYRDSLSGIHNNGVSWCETNIYKGIRQSSYRSYIKNLPKKKNLSIRKKHLVNRVIFEKRKAVGVEISPIENSNISSIIRSKRGVILCAGAINTPHILLLSGIGPASKLAHFGISIVNDLPGVGENLIEHPGVYIHADMKSPSQNIFARPWNIPIQILRWILFKNGPMAIPAAQLYAFHHSKESVIDPNLQFLFFAYGVLLKGTKRYIPNKNLVTMLLNLTHPKSRGFLSLKDKNSRVPIQIHPQLLSSDEDIQSLILGINFLRKIIRTSPFSDSIKSLINFSISSSSYEEDYNFIRNNTRPFHHSCGTCKMGIDHLSVVSPSLRVHGCENIWVADASIFPLPVAGNINATTLMIGEKAADLILSNL
ncbi:MAG: GMC family oxidoreductase N-terminal domain-containing protein [Cardiobacteriaceae bacterium]|nr:GMC family oxidoreductase N-terminal domain-containing protein [Cardiobacteriaceae bacterium]